MKGYAFIAVSILLTSCRGLCPADCDKETAAAISGRKIVGPTAVINVKEANLDFLARIDTGARTTSIHAENVKVVDADKDIKKNVGKRITFDSYNHKGKKVSLDSVVKEVAQVKNSQGTEYRYVISLNLGKDGVHKPVSVNLRDRTKMEYKLLIGRNWLTKDYIVDIDKK